MTDMLSTRPASAAIAAVLALSATTLSAQEVTAAPPAAPAIAPSVAVQAPPAPVIVLQAQPAAPVAPVAVAEQAVTPTVVARAAPVRRATTPVRQTATVERTTPVTVASSPMPRTATTSAAASAPAEVRIAAPQTPAASAPVASAPTVTDRVSTTTDSGLGVGELGLIGGALAVGGIAAAALLSRRRRRDLDAEPFEAATDTFATPVPFAPRARTMNEPVVRYETQPTPMPARRPVMADTGAGRHVRAAEAGPSAANPFLTRANRMRRARFMDAQEAREAETMQPRRVSGR